MKAILLAAGLGTRLQPYTDECPKCLMPINGEPLLAIWFGLLAKHNIEEVLINTHHYAHKVVDFIEQTRSQFDLRITLVHEPELLGSAGTVWANRNFVKTEADFIIAYADNLTNVDLTKLVDFHCKQTRWDGVLTMGLFKAPEPRACGIAELAENGRIKTFIEKPLNPNSDLANAGIYVASSQLLEIMAKARHGAADGVFDFGFHLLPALAGKMYGYEIKQYLVDIGTIEAYHKAQKQWPPKEPHER
jgi:mannose-1-phosphate guanylyltransferase